MEERRVLIGNPASPGIAMAEAYHYEPLVGTIETGFFKVGKETEYWKAFMEAHARTKLELEQLCEKLLKDSAEQATIFAAHILLLEDETLMYEIRNAILNDRMFPEIAIEACFAESISQLRSVEDDLIAERAADLVDVKERLLRNYTGKKERSLSHLEKDVIVIAKDLLPSDAATLDKVHVKGIITEIGGVNSHVAILAKSYRIPMITGVENVLSKIAAGELVVMDAVTGEMIVGSIEEK